MLLILPLLLLLYSFEKHYKSLHQGRLYSALILFNIILLYKFHEFHISYISKPDNTVHRLPVTEKIAEEIQIPVYGINCDEDKEIAARYEVDTIPNLIFFRDGKPVDSIIGFGNVGYMELMEFIKKNDVK